MNPPSINFEQVKKWITFVIAVVAMLLGVLNAINDALPAQIGEPPVAVTNQGVTNLDDLTLSGALTADSVTVDTVTAETVTATTIVSQAVTFDGTDATLSGDVTAGTLAVGGGYGSTGCTLSAAGVLQCNGAATIDGATTSTGLLTANAGIAVDSTAFTVADTSGNVNTAGTLGIGGVTFTGAIKYGTVATYTSGSSITHGFATTPTVCVMQPARDVTATLTITTTGFSSDMADLDAPIYWMCGK